MSVTDPPERPDVEGILKEAQGWIGAFASKTQDLCRYIQHLEASRTPRPTHVHVHRFPDGGMVGEVLPGKGASDGE